ncbi:MAG: long-chain fatty acid transport protein, partial [Phenylobacterium sp.]|nr:long-chain fatty acid transport protein [Phenylobacterium sp.]
SVQVGAAAHATPWLDVGAGVEAQTMSALLDSASPNLNPAPADGVQRLSGTGWNYGWTVGAQAHTDTLRVGLSYRSSVRHRLHGQISLSGLQAPLDGANFTAPAETMFSTPWTASLAARWQVSPALTLDGQVVRTGWSKYDTITVNFAGTTAAIPQSYKDTTSVALGADYAFAAGWTVRGGVQYDPTPTHDFLREPGVPDGDRWIYALGASRTLGAGAKLNGALAYTDFRQAGINAPKVFYGGTPALTTAAVVGRFSGHQLTASLGLDWDF